MKTIIKSFLIFVAFATNINIVSAQTPYDDFAPSSKKKEMLKLPEMQFKVANAGEPNSSNYLVFDKDNLILTYYSKSDSVLKMLAIAPNNYKWLSIDPKIKAGESPYAAFSDSPIYLVDQDGRDTLVVHRSEVTSTAYNVKIYTVTFSIIKNGIETAMQTAHSYSMFTNAEASNNGYNDLDKKPVYNLKWQGMAHHPEWLNTVNIYKESFLHKAGDASWLGGCVGFFRQEDGTKEEVLPGITTFTVPHKKSEIAMQDLKDIYNDVDANYNLTGAKFIMKTKSVAPVIPTVTPVIK